MTFQVSSGEEAPAAQEAVEQIGPLLDRLEALSTALEGLAGGERTYSAEAVLETLTRMERRDLHAISAIDTFATALKSVSQHLAHLRQAMHVSNTQNGAKLDALVARLGGIEARLGAGPSAAGFDLAPLAAALDSIGLRLAGLETKLDSVPQQQSHWPFDTDAVANALAAIADRLARVESKVDSVAQQPTLEPEATSDMLATIARRVSRVEHKVDSGADGTSIAACLLAVDRRLSRIEGGLGMDLPLPAAEEIPDLAEVMEVEGAPKPTDEHFYLDEPDLPPEAPPRPEAASHERVNQLLEQVFRVLAR